MNTKIIVYSVIKKLKKNRYLISGLDGIYPTVLLMDNNNCIYRVDDVLSPDAGIYKILVTSVGQQPKEVPERFLMVGLSRIGKLRNDIADITDTVVRQIISKGGDNGESADFWRSSLRDYLTKCGKLYGVQI